MARSALALATAAVNEAPVLVALPCYVAPVQLSDSPTSNSTPKRLSYLDLVQVVNDATRHRVMQEGVAPSFESLAGWEFAGTNTGGASDLLGIRKFKKGFYAGAPRVTEGPQPYIQGYNVIVEQNGVGKPHIATPTEATAKRHGFYRVHAVIPGATDNVYPNALLLDYGLGRNGIEPSGLLRDYLVQVYADDPDLLLGRAFFAVAGMRIHGGYFVLARDNRFDYSSLERASLELRGRHHRPATL